MCIPQIMEAETVGALYTQAPRHNGIQSIGVVYQSFVQCKFFLNLYNFPHPDNSDDGTANDSPWATIGGVMKYFRMSYEEVVFNRSYLNIMLLNRSIPSWDTSSRENNDNDNIGNKNTNTYHAIDKSVHASDFFMDMMG